MDLQLFYIIQCTAETFPLNMLLESIYILVKFVIYTKINTNLYWCINKYVL